MQSPYFLHFRFRHFPHLIFIGLSPLPYFSINLITDSDILGMALHMGVVQSSENISSYNLSYNCGSIFLIFLLVSLSSIFRILHLLGMSLIVSLILIFPYNLLHANSYSSFHFFSCLIFHLADLRWWVSLGTIKAIFFSIMLSHFILVLRYAGILSSDFLTCFLSYLQFSSAIPLLLYMIPRFFNLFFDIL